MNKSTAECIYVDFAIIDTGIGISADKQEMVFDRFAQANSNITREYGGSGLGLTIIRLLLQLQNSEIHLKSEMGVGSKFYFTLCFKKSNSVLQDETSSAPKSALPDLKKPGFC